MKNIKPASFIIASAWTCILIFSVIHNTSNNRFPVTYVQEQSMPGYETREAFYSVQVSPAWAWDKSGGHFLGYLFLAIMWTAFFAVASDLHLKFTRKGKGAGALGTALIGLPLLLSVIFFFSASSNVFANNYIGVPEKQFQQWEADGKIEQKGENTWVDATADKVLWHSFDNKETIR